MQLALTRNRRVTFARSLLFALAVLALGAVVGPREANAGTYTVNECRGDVGSDYFGAPDAVFSTNSVYQTYNSCPTAHDQAFGVGVTHPGYSFSVAANGSQTFTAPDGALFDSMDFRGILGNNSGHSTQIAMIYPNGTSNFFTTQPGGGGGVVANNTWFNGTAVPGSNLKHLVAAIACGGSCPFTGTYGYVGLYELKFTLNDFTAPKVDSLGGSLMSPGTRRGTETLTITASDQGGGVRRAVVTVNGSQIASIDNPNCAILATSLFNRLRPCSTSAQLPLSVDTETSPWRPGMNTLEVCAADVAKSSSTPNTGCTVRQIEVDNSCEPSSEQASVLEAAFEREGSSAREITVESNEGVPVKGSLRSGGAGVPAASVCIYEQIDAPGEVRELLAIARTRSNGTFGVQLAPGPSRELEVVYRRNNSVLQAPDLHVYSKAQPELKVRPKRLENGEAARFKGSIPGPYAAGKAIALQARAGKKWRTFKQLRTDADGRFKGKYPFRHTRGRVTYRFRVLLKRQEGYPYLPGPSRERKVRVSG